MSAGRWRVCIAALLALGASGCLLDRQPLIPEERLDAGRDAGAARDAGHGEDAGHAGPPDAGPPDSGPPDSGPPDSGPPDAGPPDAGPPILTVTGGLLVHFDALRVAGDEAPVASSPTTWVDLTGGNDAACSQVRFQADAIGPGRPGMRTNGGSMSKCAFPIPDFGDVTILVVLRTADTRSGPTWWESPVIVGGDTAGVLRDAALFVSGGQVGFARRNTTFQSTLAIADGAPHLVSMVRVRESGEVTLQVDESTEATVVDATRSIADPDTWWLASHGIEGLGGLEAIYGEVLIYERALTDTELATVREYLRARWL